MTPIVPAEDVQQWTEQGFWGERALSDVVAERAARSPEHLAYVEPHAQMSWAEYDRLASELAGALARIGVGTGDRVAVLLADGADFHVALLGIERAGAVAVGIGPRAGDAEIAHLVSHTGSRVLITHERHRDRAVTDLADSLRSRNASLRAALTLGPRGSQLVEHDLDSADLSVRGGSSAHIGPNDLWMLNSTSGTTGLAKCVTQFQNRWFYFTELARKAGGLHEQDVLLGAVPSPFGFGLWSAHFAPVVLGIKTVLLPEFSVEQMVRLIERERVSVLCCVSTQFRMLLNSPLAEEADLSSLRVMFTGGEAVPYQRAAEFEDRTGARVLQFFGSNETGALSYTTMDDPREQRLSTCGRVIPEMDVRLFDDDGRDITAGGGPGQPAGRGPLTCAGYYADEHADAQLYTRAGHMLMGDLATIDEGGYLRVVGRKADLIIRGGKNISAAQVESVVEGHPAIELVAVVGIPDPVYGERICAVVSLRAGYTLELTELLDDLLARDVSKELLPERLAVVDALPRGSGGKIAKAEVRALALSQF